MKLLKLLIVLCLVFLLFPSFLKAEKGSTKTQNQINLEFAQSVTKSDFEQIFQLMFENRRFGFPEGKAIYIIENQFIDASFKIQCKTNPVMILKQEEFNNVKKVSGEPIGSIEILDIDYTGSQLDPKDFFGSQHKNSVSIHYKANYYGGDGEHGYRVFAKENGKWVGVNAFSFS